MGLKYGRDRGRRLAAIQCGPAEQLMFRQVLLAQYVRTVSAEVASSTSLCGVTSSTPSRTDASIALALLDMPDRNRGTPAAARASRCSDTRSRAHTRGGVGGLRAGELDSVAGEEDLHVVSFFGRGACDEQGKRGAGRILRAGRAVDEDACHG